MESIADEKRKAGILGSVATQKALVEKFVGEDGVVRCVSCGGTPIEWHHVVPIEVGGKDIVSNIFPVCVECHRLIHLGENYRLKRLEDARKMVKNGGRKRSVPDNNKELLNDYVYCRIGKKELAERWGVTVTSRKDPTQKIGVYMVRLTGKSWYRDYLRELGIKKVDNRIDIVYNRGSNRSVVAEGEYVGTITYLDGRTVDIYYGEPIEQAN